MTATDVNGDSDCHKVDAKEYASPVPTERLRDLKRQETHRRLVDVGYRMINQRGYVETTTADIAAAAGVTERTFFRHFASKGEVIIAAWRGLAAALADAVQGAPGTDSPIDVVRAGLHAFTREFASDNDTTRANARTLWANRQLVVLLLDVVIDCEQHIAGELAKRWGRSDNDLDVRVVANASIGVLRAVIREALAGDGHRSVAEAVDAGLARIAPIFPPAR